MKKRVAKRTALIVALLISVFMSTMAFQEIFCRPLHYYDENRLAFFHKEPRDSMDVVVMGSSDVYAGWAPAVAYRETGITSFSYALSGGTVVNWKTMLDDILEHQSPELIIVEPFGACYDNKTLVSRESQVKKVFNTLPLSISKIKRAKEIDAKSENVTTSDLLFPFISYHNLYGKYLENAKNYFAVKKYEHSPLKGMSNVTKISNPPVLYNATKDTETKELDTISEEYLIDFLEYAKEKNVNLVFIRFPQNFAQKYEEQHISLLRANKIGKIVAKYGYPYLNCQQHWDEIGLDSYHDLYNRAHLNIYGHEKLTKFVSRYLSSELGLKPAGRGNDIRENWNEALLYYDAYQKFSDECIKKDVLTEIGDSPDVFKRLEKYTD